MLRICVATHKQSVRTFLGIYAQFIKNHPTVRHMAIVLSHTMTRSISWIYRLLEMPTTHMSPPDGLPHPHQFTQLTVLIACGCTRGRRRGGKGGHGIVFLSPVIIVGLFEETLMGPIGRECHRLVNRDRECYGDPFMDNDQGRLAGNVTHQQTLPCEHIISIYYSQSTWV